MPQKFPFPVDPELTQISMAYRNRMMIADSVLPIVPVGKRSFKYTVYSKDERFTVPDTLVGRKSRVNEVEFGTGEETASVRDYGLEDPIPQSDIDEAPSNYNPVEHAVEAIQDLLALDREVRVANMIMNASNYAAGNKTTLTKAWTDPTSDAIGDIHAAQDAVAFMDVNVMTLGKADWRILSTHPQIVKAVNKNSGDTGIVTRQQVADLFELEEILIGASRVNTAKKGQTASLQRAWTGGVQLQYRAQNINSRNGLTFGFSGEHGDRMSGQWEDKNIGLHGGQRVRYGMSIVELITAADLGYLIKGIQ